VVIDMSNFVQLSVDPTSFIATIGPGNRLGDVALGLNNVGRALPHGTCPYVGIGGHLGRQLIATSGLFFYLFVLS
jgi:FAD/FMN-containing dehydrogenase